MTKILLSLEYIFKHISFSSLNTEEKLKLIKILLPIKNGDY